MRDITESIRWDDGYVVSYGGFGERVPELTGKWAAVAALLERNTDNLTIFKVATLSPYRSRRVSRREFFNYQG